MDKAFVQAMSRCVREMFSLNRQLPLAFVQHLLALAHFVRPCLLVLDKPAREYEVLWLSSVRLAGWLFGIGYGGGVAPAHVHTIAPASHALNAGLAMRHPAMR